MRKAILLLTGAVVLLGGYYAAQVLIPRHDVPRNPEPVIIIETSIPKVATSP